MCLVFYFSQSAFGQTRGRFQDTPSECTQTKDEITYNLNKNKEMSPFSSLLKSLIVSDQQLNVKNTFSI